MLSKTNEYRKAYWKKWKSENRPPQRINCECGAQFFPRGPQKRCDSCRTHKCPICARFFKDTSGRNDRKFCSKPCANKSRSGSEPIQLQNKRGRKPRSYFKRRGKYGSVEDREWRMKIFERDTFRCVICLKTGRLNADHIKPIATHPELRHVISNGRSLCVECHKKTPTFGWRGYWAKVRLNKTA